MANALTYQSEFTGQQMDERFTAVATLTAALEALTGVVAQKYVKPSDGIPSTDMTAAVQASLAKAESAVQSLADYYTKTEVDQLLAAINGMDYVDVAALPTASASTMGKIYLVGPDGSGYYSYYYTSYDGSAYSWVGPLGTTEISLSNYATKAELNQLDQELGHYSPEWELGNISISGNGWTYSSSNKRVRTKQGTTIHLYEGDFIKLSDHLTARYYLGWQKLDGTYNARGWSQEDFIVAEEGYYVILMTSVPEATESSTSNLSSKISFVANHVPSVQIPLLDAKIENASGKYDYVLYAPKPGAHSSSEGLHPIQYKAGTTLRGKITPGTAVSDGTSTRVYLYDAGGNAIGNKSISLGQEFTFSAEQDAAYVSFYISSITDIGTFNVELRYGGVQQLEEHFPLGTNDGYGSINLSAKFKETIYSFPDISQSIFDTTAYAVGVQGIAIYEDTYAVFIINATDPQTTALQKIGAVIVNLATSEKLGEFEITTANAKSHGNNACFGAKYSEDDTLPLLYISLTYSPSECIVLRIDNSFTSCTLVQTIVFNGSTHLSDINTLDWILDGGDLWAYGSYWDNNNSYVKFARFSLPATSSPSVSLGDADVLEEFTVHDLRIAQGATIVNKKIYIALGYTSGVMFVKVVNISTHAIEAVVNFAYEPEGVAVYKGKLAVARSGNYIRFSTFEDGI